MVGSRAWFIHDEQAPGFPGPNESFVRDLAGLYCRLHCRWNCLARRWVITEETRRGEETIVLTVTTKDGQFAVPDRRTLRYLHLKDMSRWHHGIASYMDFLEHVEKEDQAKAKAKTHGDIDDYCDYFDSGLREVAVEAFPTLPEKGDVSKRVRDSGAGVPA